MNYLGYCVILLPFSGFVPEPVLLPDGFVCEAFLTTWDDALIWGGALAIGVGAALWYFVNPDDDDDDDDDDEKKKKDHGFFRRHLELSKKDGPYFGKRLVAGGTFMLFLGLTGIYPYPDPDPNSPPEVMKDLVKGLVDRAVDQAQNEANQQAVAGFVNNVVHPAVGQAQNEAAHQMANEVVNALVDNAVGQAQNEAAHQMANEVVNALVDNAVDLSHLDDLYVLSDGVISLGSPFAPEFAATVATVMATSGVVDSVVEAAPLLGTPEFAAFWNNLLSVTCVDGSEAVPMLWAVYHLMGHADFTTLWDAMPLDRQFEIAEKILDLATTHHAVTPQVDRAEIDYAQSAVLARLDELGIIDVYLFVWLWPRQRWRNPVAQR